MIMLTKNVYILFPAGYSGNYVNWAISISDLDMRAHTVSDPINQNDSQMFGGSGTSHLHTRIPTHMGIKDHLLWIAYNRPVEKKIYVIFTQTSNLSETLSSICRYDPDPVFVVIHDNGDADTRVYGNLNCFDKWPSYFHTVQVLVNYSIENNKSPRSGTTNYDFFNCKQDRNLRNTIGSSNLDHWLVAMSPLDHFNKDSLRYDIKRAKLWYDTRKSLQPHELPASVHLIPEDLPWSNIFQISCLDVASDRLCQWLPKLISACSDNFDCDYLCSFHQNYVQAQKNLQWFNAINHWRQTGELMTFLTGSSYVEGFVIKEMLKIIKQASHLDNVLLKDFLSIWPSLSLEDINQRFKYLTNHQ